MLRGQSLWLIPCDLFQTSSSINKISSLGAVLTAACYGRMKNRVFSVALRDSACDSARYTDSLRESPRRYAQPPPPGALLRCLLYDPAGVFLDDGP